LIIAGIAAATAVLLVFGRSDAATSGDAAAAMVAPPAELVVRSADGGAVSFSLLSRSGYGLERPKWSRDGEWVSVVRQQCASCRKVLIAVPVRGASRVRVELGGSREAQPSGGVSWSRSSVLAVALVDSEGERTVAIVRGSHVRELRGLDDANEPDWSPDGRRLAFTAEFDEIRRIVIERVATRRREVWAHGNRSEDQPVWSPSGGRVAFTRLEPSMTWDICVGALASADVRCITHTSSNERDPAWSPDGRRIAFSSDAGAVATGARAVYVMDADGTHLRGLSGGSFDSWGPAWSPDGTKLAFVRRPLSSAP